jgi:predicted transcriptional regulator
LDLKLEEKCGEKMAKAKKTTRKSKKTPKSTKTKKTKGSQLMEIATPKNSIVSHVEKTAGTPIKLPPRKRMVEEDGSFNKNAFFDIMGNDIRRKIISKLAKFPRYASDLAIDLGVSKQAVKKQLDKLINFGLIEESTPSGEEDQKKQYYQISMNVALSAQIDLTPNYFQLNAENKPEDLIAELNKMKHNPKTALLSSTVDEVTYKQLGHSLNYLGSQLHLVEKKILELETKRKVLLFEKTVLLNRIQLIMNAMVENDLEKEVIFSLFFNINSTVEGLSLDEILNQLFLRKRNRAGISKSKVHKPDEKTVERAHELFKLLQILIKNFEFIHSVEGRLFFDFDEF